jgi:four helix bundle protein
MTKEIVTFRDLDAWQVAMGLTMTAYRLAQQLPSSERFELSSQIRRAAVSVPANVAEGHSSGSPGLCIRHLRIALGSLGELSTHFEVALRLGFFQSIAVEEAEEEVTRTGQLLYGLLRAKRRQQAKAAVHTLALLLGTPAIGWMILAVLR